MRWSFLFLLFPLFLQAIDFEPDDYNQKGFKIICDEKTSEIVVTSEMHSKIWGTNLKTNQYELNRKYVNELQKKDRFFLPFDLDTTCTVNEQHFKILAGVPQREPTGWCGYNPDPKVSVSLNATPIIDWVSFDEMCTGESSITKIVLFLKNKPSMEICFTKDNIHTTNKCIKININNSPLIPLTQDKLEMLK